MALRNEPFGRKMTGMLITLLLIEQNPSGSDYISVLLDQFNPLLVGSTWLLLAACLAGLLGWYARRKEGKMGPMISRVSSPKKF